MNNKILKTELVKWKDIKLFQPAELKKLTNAQMQKLKTSLKENGFKTPFYVWENKQGIWCLDGHIRIPIMKLLEDEGESIPVKLPANFIDCKNKKEAKKAVVIYNSHYADIIQDNLNEWIKDLDFEDLNTEIDIKGINFDIPFPETINDDEISDEVKPVTKFGDLWELGRHRVLCGDTTKIEDVERLMDGQKADMVFTSPPYNANSKMSDGSVFDNKSVDMYKKKGKDNRKSEDYIIFTNKAIEMCFQFTDGFIFWNVSYNSKSRHEYLKQIYNKVEYIIEQICWKKSATIPFKGCLKREWEPIYVFSTNKKGLGVKEIKGNFWEVNNKCVQTKDHKACFPTGIVEKAIELVNKNSGIVSDFFLGSGSTLIACEKTNRICYGMEIDEHYCDVIINRYNNWCIDNNIKSKIKLNGDEFNLNAFMA